MSIVSPAFCVQIRPPSLAVISPAVLCGVIQLLLGGERAWGGRESDGRLRYLGSEEGSGSVDEFTSDDDDLLSGEDLLGDDGGESTQKVTLSVNNLSECFVSAGEHCVGIARRRTIGVEEMVAILSEKNKSVFSVFVRFRVDSWSA